jgi:hypothetical protein
VLTQDFEISSKEPVISSVLRISALALSICTCLAEDLTLPNSAIMRADRSLVSIKAGTVVEVLERGDKTISIRYKGQTGTIPASSLVATGPSAASAPAAAKPAPPAAKTAAAASGSVVVDHPQSFYGNLVKKAETNIAKHDENLVKPANEAADEGASK